MAAHTCNVPKLGGGHIDFPQKSGGLEMQGQAKKTFQTDVVMAQALTRYQISIVTHVPLKRPLHSRTQPENRKMIFDCPADVA